MESIRGWNGHPPDGLDDAKPQIANPVSGDFGNYELFEVVGRGGMAEVYRARHKRLQRDVALKLIRVPRWHMAESLNRIEREMRAVGKLNHPAIVNAVDAGEHEGVQFLVTEFIDGMDVGKIARAIGPLPVAEACEIVRIAALGLDHAHAHGIVHRDIKPSNLMLDKTGAVKILDFGLVHLDGWTGVSAEVTSVGQLLGTLDYMAPEQADRAENVNHRSDVYSLGATLFRLLCGRAPYAASSNQSPLEKLRLLANERPPSVATLRPELPTELSALIDRTLDRDPANRPASAAHLAESLKPFCGSAELASLLAKAKSLPNSGDEIMSASMNSAAPSIASLVWGDANAKPLAKLATKSSGGFRRIAWCLVGLAMFSAAVFAGIVLILETQKGQVTIETDIPDLHVELVTDGKVRKEIELVPGENMTRIYAGQYEIRISHGTDRYVIDQNAFVLKRGEKVIAKITVDESAKKAEIAWSDNSHAFRAEPKTESGYTDPQKWIPLDELERCSFAVYQIQGDIELYHRVLSTMLAKENDLQMEVDKEGSRLMVHATGRTHEEIEKLLATLNNSAKSAIATFAGPVYEGKSLDEWMNILEYETSSTLLDTAAQAVYQITRRHKDALTSTRERLVQQVKVDATQTWLRLVVEQIGFSPSNIDELEKIIDDSGSEMAREVFRVLAHSADSANIRRDFTQTSRLLNVLKRMIKRKEILEDPEFPDFLKMSADWAIRTLPDYEKRFVLWSSEMETVYSEWTAFVLDNPMLGPEFVFDSHFESTAVTQPTRSLLLDAATQQIETLGTDDAKFRRNVLIIGHCLKSGVNDDARLRLLKVLDTRLSELSNSDDVFEKCSFFEPETRINDTFVVNYYQFFKTGSFESVLKKGWNFSLEDQSNPFLDLLRLYEMAARDLKSGYPQTGVQQILEASKSARESLNRVVLEMSPKEEVHSLIVYWQKNEARLQITQKSDPEIGARGGGLGGEFVKIVESTEPLNPSIAMGAVIHELAARILGESVIDSETDGEKKQK